MENPSGYDVIGDIHGYSDVLEALLKDLGYREVNGAYRQTGRQVIFVGDLIDRGPGQLRTVEVARNMVEAGSAQMVLGNHEFNAIGWVTPVGDGFARVHNHNHRSQHQVFLDSVGEGSALHHEIINWFRTIPMWLDLNGLRVVHACWDPANMNRLGDGTLTDQIIESPRGSELFDAAEIVLKGPEIHLRGNSFRDWNDHQRFHARFRWWDPTVTDFLSAIEVLDWDTSNWLNTDEPIDRAALTASPEGEPVLFGHYWRDGQPTIYSPLTACLDWSVPKGGPLVAYRWSGEEALTNDNLAWVDKP